MNSLRVLIIDDSADDRDLIRRALALNGDIREAGSLASAREVLAGGAWTPSVILLDVSLPDGAGEFGASWDAVREFAATAPVIVCTGQPLADCPELPQKAREAGAAYFTSKDLILTSPDHLIRMIDWVVHPQTQGAARAELHERAVKSMEIAHFDESSFPVMLARMMDRQNSMHEDNQRVAGDTHRILEDILAQARKTNGRVNKLEDWKASQQQFRKNVAWVAGILVPMFLFLSGDQLKERALIDKEAVRRIAAEQIAASAQKLPVAAGTP